MDDLISRQAAIDRATKEHDFFRGAVTVSDKARRDELLNVMCWLGELPPAQPEPYTDALKAEIRRMKMSFTICINSDYYTGYMSALSAVERYIAQMEETDGNHN